MAVMGPPQQFCVRWNSYQTNLQNAFPKLLNAEHFVDVTLACENEMLKCHKVVLSACSTYFEKLLLDNPCQHPIVFMKDMKFQELQSLVDFMYKGEVNVSQDELPSLLRSAEALQIRGLWGSDQLLNLQQIQGALNRCNSGSTTPTSNSTHCNSSKLHSNTSSHCQTNDGNLQSESIPSCNGNTSPEHISGIPSDIDSRSGLQQSSDQNDPSKFLQNIDESRHHDHGDMCMPSTPLALQMASTTMGQGSSSECGDSNDELHGHIKNEDTELIKNEEGNEDESASYYDNEPDLMELGEQYMDEDSQAQLMHDHLNKTPDFAIANVSCHYDGSGSGMSASSRRIRRSDEELRRAAECITRGQTFQMVSDKFNIPISTIRFYMARKGILPRRKRGRACTTNAGTSGGSIGLGLMQSATGQSYASTNHHQSMQQHQVQSHVHHHNIGMPVSSSSPSPSTTSSSPSNGPSSISTPHLHPQSHHHHHPTTPTSPIGPPYHLVHYKLPPLGVSRLK